MNELTALVISVRAAIRACDLNGVADTNDAFMRGHAAAHRKIGAFLSGAIDRCAIDDGVMRDAMVQHVAQLRDAATDATRREFLHRLLGSLRKV